ncbi:LamB/YcsF family protein [Salibacterium aidingense]|uniref:LamB/YcsF family protein n=1 Tax=Salibacterium aidingense TaxID=384933 RepID=UPI003BDFC26F
MSLTIDLNSDVGESFGAYVLGNDESVLSYITSANIACGYHAGDHNIMAKTVAAAKKSQTAAGAHPGFPDLGGFGRRPMVIDPEEIYHLVLYQVGALQGFCEAEGMALQHVKPHGALYNQAAKDPEIAEAVAKAVRCLNPKYKLFGLAGSELVNAGENESLQVASEVFADRTYQPDGSLTPRSRPDAVLHDPGEAGERIIHMLKHQETTAIDGTKLQIRADTICVHGDNPRALQFLQYLHDVLKKNGVEMKAVGDKQ